MNTEPVLIIDEEKKFTMADLEKLRRYVTTYSGDFVGLTCPKELSTCIECPFRGQRDGISQFAPDKQAAIEHRIKHLGGFPCHMIEGDGKAFEWTGETKHQCRGWRNAGGDLAAFQRRYRMPDYVARLPEISIFEYLERAGCA